MYAYKVSRSQEYTRASRPKLNLAQLNNETTSWLRFVCQLTVSRPVNSLCKVLFQLSLTVLVCYRCRSRIMRSLTSSLPRTLSCTLKQLDSNKSDLTALRNSWRQCLHGMGLTPALAQPASQVAPTRWSCTISPSQWNLHARLGAAADCSATTNGVH